MVAHLGQMARALIDRAIGAGLYQPAGILGKKRGG
jgi:hypothetical protein